MKLYNFRDGKFRFYVMEWKDCGVVFRVREDTDPFTKAKEKGYEGFDRIVPADDDLIEQWLKEHPDYPIITRKIVILTRAYSGYDWSFYGMLDAPFDLDLEEAKEEYIKYHDDNDINWDDMLLFGRWLVENKDCYPQKYTEVNLDRGFNVIEQTSDFDY